MAAQPFQGASSNRTCQFCSVNEASHYCDCMQPPALFCLDCGGRHNAKFPRVIHPAIPIVALSQSPEEYRCRSEALANAAAELRKNVERAEQFSVKFGEMMQQVVDYCVNYRSWGLQLLQTETEELRTWSEYAIEEANTCLDQGLQPASPLGHAVWTLPPEQLQVFTCAMNAPDIQTLCQSWAQYQNHLHSFSQPLQQENSFYAAVTRNSVELYNVSTQESTQHTISVDFGNGGSYIALDKQTLLCLGGNTMSTTVYTLDLSSLLLTSLPSLHISRCGAGVAKTPRFVFVFRSAPGSVSCEKYALEGCEWVPLGNMKHGRYGFTPCTFHALIYLPSPKTTLIIESFSPETELFTELPVTLPIQMQGSPSVAFVASEELCVLTGNKQMGKWNIEVESEFRLSATERNCWSTQPPLILDSLVLIADAISGKVMKFNLETPSFS